MELRNAYPQEAGINSWKREISLKRGIKSGSVIIADSYELDDVKPVTYYLITPVKPVVLNNSNIMKFNIDNENVIVSVSSTNSCKVTVEETPPLESRLIRNWGEKLYRVVISEEASSGESKILIASDHDGN